MSAYAATWTVPPQELQRQPAASPPSLQLTVGAWGKVLVRSVALYSACSVPPKSLMHNGELTSLKGKQVFG